MRYPFALLLSLASIAAAPALRAQEDAAKLELYGGYSYIRFNINSMVSGQPPSQVFNGNGGTGQITYNVNNWLGAVGDAGGFWATRGSAGGAAIPYLFGPRLNLRRKWFTPFAEVLFGGVVTSSGIATLGWQSHFAMTAGGGIDVKVSKHISLRPVHAEYFMTTIPDGLNNRQNNFQFSTGISLLFGGR